MTKKIVLTFTENWKVLVISLIAQLTITVLLNLGLHPPAQLSFLSFPGTTINSEVNKLPDTADVLEKIKPQLQQKTNQFSIKKKTSLIPAAQAADSFDLASAYIAIDYDSGEVLQEKRASEPLAMASVTKIMTAVVSLDLASPEELFTVSPRAAKIPPTAIGVVPGQRLSLEELLNALLLTSANDAAAVIEDGIETKYLGNPAREGGASSLLVEAMNSKAEILGLRQTHFTNPQGFDDPRHYTSAEDLAILAHYALSNYPLIAQIVKKDYEFLPTSTNHKQYDLYNWNGLIGVYPGVFGVKIGNTDAAGKTTVVAAEREGKKVMAVVLGAPGVLERDLWAAKLLDEGFQKMNLPPVEVSEENLRAKYSTWVYYQ